ncbi:MAG: aminotransferase class V-fold PLP-dependent enzyme [Candidatus Hodarchaeota archaeon]
MTALNISKIRNDFPVLHQQKNDKPIVYLDNACMSLRPTAVIDTIKQYYLEFSACGGRTIHKLGMAVTEGVESARKKVMNFINAKKSSECIFTGNTTNGINIVAMGLGLSKGDLVISEDYAHNSNVIPWQMLKRQNGIIHHLLETGSDALFTIETLDTMLRKSQASKKLVSLCHVSNVTGYAIPAKEIIKVAHDHDALVLLDSAQSVPHQPVDVQKLDVDFLAFSIHKMCGPSGIGVLYGKEEFLETLTPRLVGGGTVVNVTEEGPEFAKTPDRFEAGLQNYAGIIATGTTIDYLQNLGMENIHRYEKTLAKYLFIGLKELNLPLKTLGPQNPAKREGLAAIAFDNINAHDIAMLLDEENIFTRSGTHCTHLWHNKLGINATLRPSLYFYNTKQEIQFFLDTLEKSVKIFL